MKYQQLNAKKFGLGLGILCAIGCFLLGLFSLGGYGAEIVNLIGTVYIGYQPTFWGSVLGAIYGFIDGFIGGWLLALIYNKLL